jgi:hypothetical protein
LLQNNIGGEWVGSGTFIAAETPNLERENQMESSEAHALLSRKA